MLYVINLKYSVRKIAVTCTEQNDKLCGYVGGRGDNTEFWLLARGWRIM
jgi:hypothetical protein